ncbi:MAG: site-specific integrase [Bryobacterales bacterium]|nr:site-specific integrase [Bryobacterales bacterium]
MSVYKPKYRDPKTGELKQAKVWWYEFIFAGRRVKESSKSTRKTIAEESERNKRLELERALAGIPTEKREDRIRTVATALEDYRKGYGVNHREKSLAWVKGRAAHVERILGTALIPDITETRITDYMSKRLEEGGGHRTVNMEIECLARAIGRPWGILWPKVQRLEEPKDTGRALAVEEEQKLLAAAAKNKSRMILPFLKIALLTGMRFGEIRRLKWFQVDLEQRLLTVGKAKTEAGSGRVIPMNAALYSTFAAHAGWLARKLEQPIQPDWYVFPFCNRVRPVDPTRPVTTIKSAWERAREDAGVNCRFHDLRHTACTKMAEGNVPEATMKALMGHMSRAMLERYSHIRLAAKRAAVESLSLPEVPVSNGVPQVSTQVGRNRRIQ